MDIESAAYGQVIGKVSQALKRVKKPALVTSALMNMFTQVSPYNYEVLGFILECLDGGAAAEDGRGEEELVRRASQGKQKSRFWFTYVGLLVGGWADAAESSFHKIVRRCMNQYPHTW